MSLFSAMMASVSGMQAQANSLSTISDNIANSDTTGYKQASTQFEDLLSQLSTTSYTAGGVGTIVNFAISQQGAPTAASSPTDLAIQGNGFFVVQNAGGQTYLTRAGNFAPNVNGNLVNSAGFTLMGYPITPGSTAAPTNVNQLSQITVSSSGLSAAPSTAGTMDGNLPSNAAVDGGVLPSANTAASTYTDMTSVTAYDNLGNPVNLNVYFTKTGANTWNVDVFNAATATAGGFPYGAAGSPSLLSTTLTFSGTTGALTTGSPLAIPVPNGSTLNLNMSGMTQLAASFGITQNNINGNAPVSFSSIAIATDGTVSEVYSDGSTQAIAKIPLATVPSVNSLTSSAGDVFSANSQSGNIVVGGANTSGFGSINSQQLESSTVDLASQLTNMVVAQNSYAANSKVFQTGSTMLSQLLQMLNA
ncbi:MAG: flagellar hook protein FlgE [Methylovirgula sp.]